MKLKIILEESEEGGYTAYLPSLPGCLSEGDTAEEPEVPLIRRFHVK